MNDWISRSLLTLALAVLMIPSTQRLIGQADRAGGDCAGGGCGNLRQLQDTLEGNTIRFSRPPDRHLRKTAP